MTIVASVFSALAAMENSWKLAASEPTRTFDGIEPDIADMVAMSLGLCSPAVSTEATLLWIAPDMVDLVLHAARSLPIYTFDSSVLPWPHAVLVSAKPLLTGPLPPESLEVGQFSIKGVTWMEANRKAFVVPLSDHWGPNYLSPIMMALLESGTPWTNMVPSDRAHEMSVDLRDDLSRLLCTLWLLLQQRVAVKRPAHPDRPSKRRWERENDRPIPEVVVIELRKPITTIDNEHEYQAVDWSHRWIVDGHWRNQYHPSSGTHVPTWIAPYVKGPEDKPLVVKRKVNAWVR